VKTQKNRTENGATSELNKYEKVLSHFLWVVVLLSILADVYSSYVQGYFRIRALTAQIVIFVITLFVSILRLNIIQNGMLKTKIVYICIKVADILLVVFLLLSLKHGFLFNFLIILPIVSVCITKGFFRSLPYLAFGLIVQISAAYFRPILTENFFPFAAVHDYMYYFIMLLIIYFIFAVLLLILGTYHNQFTQSEQDNQKLVTQLGKKYAQLEQARVEKQEQFDKLKEVNQQLEESNKKLTSSLAEFFTLQQISQAISSIFDMNELLQFVNDIIIGVMGVSTSNIALYSPNGERLKVHVSNIYNKKERAILTDNINSPILRQVVEQGHPFIDNAVNPDEYEFMKGRNVKSMMCVPLQVKGKGHGLVLIEHSIPDAFVDDNVRLLEIITQQVSIAIDNARLYEQLQELANTDGLTQVYNRIYFQNRLEEELRQAAQEGYEVSVILYDIDDFKYFNDSYGHLFGDIVLKSIAQMVKDSIRKDDIIARFGGEEFIILLPHTGKDLAFEKAEELRKKIAGHVIQDKDIYVSVTVSMGISTFPSLAQAESSLLKDADDSLYTAKRSGKNCIKMAQR